MGLIELRNIKASRDIIKPKKVYTIKKISDKKRAKLNECSNSELSMDKFFERMRPKMVGVCQCGCGQPSQKKDDTFYRNCICHIFPKRHFKSISTHELNWVERTFWGGHHTNMDDRSILLWKNFADWDDIVAKFNALSVLLTPEERSKKFYRNLYNIIYEK